MDRLSWRLHAAERAVATLGELLGGLDEPVRRDAAIQRFEYSVEAVWKAAQFCLREVEGTVAGSPKATVRASLAAGLLTEEDAALALEMIDDGNLTSHTYQEALAVAIASRLPAYAALLQRWLAVVGARLGR